MLRCLLALLALMAAVSTSRAEDAPAFPTRTVRLIVPAAPGGPVDVVARHLADALKSTWTEPVVVENKPGAGNSTGAIYVAQSPPDGHTLLLISDSITVNPSLYPNLDKDPLQQFEPIAVVVTAPQLLIARPDIEASSLSDFVKHRKDQEPALQHRLRRCRDDQPPHPGPARSAHRHPFVAYSVPGSGSRRDGRARKACGRRLGHARAGAVLRGVGPSQGAGGHQRRARSAPARRADGRGVGPQGF